MDSGGCIAGIFAASGQGCIAGSRLFLHEKVHDEFVERLVERTRKIRMGDPSSMESEMGPMAVRRVTRHGIPDSIGRNSEEISGPTDLL